jgi:hypothetical protein
MKLYRVKLQGMTSNIDGPAYGISYVVADNPTEAYYKVKNFLDDKDIGFDREREMGSIELIADENQYGNCGTILYL